MLRITEIFDSLQGEGLTAGLPTCFVRLTGCPLRCVYCDTAYAFSGGQLLAQEQILERVAAGGCRYVTVTGGEPLAQPGVLPLLEALCDGGYRVSLETSGERDISPVDRRVSVVMDLKTPGSGEAGRNRWSNIEHLKPGDQVKFVLCDRADYDWAMAAIADHDLARRCALLFSPVWQQLDPALLAGWMLQDRTPARLQLQLHKLLWGDQPGR